MSGYQYRDQKQTQAHDLEMVLSPAGLELGLGRNLIGLSVDGATSGNLSLGMKEDLSISILSSTGGCRRFGRAQRTAMK